MNEKQERAGETKVTSVSISKEFQKYLDDYELSPSECFRRGIAVTLYDLGIGPYQSEKNKERFVYVQKFMNQVDKDEKLKKDFEKIELYLEAKKLIDEFKLVMEKINL